MGVSFGEQGGVSFRERPREYANSYQGGVVTLTFDKNEYDALVEAGAITPDKDPAARGKGSVVLSPEATGAATVTYTPHGSEEAYNKFNIRP